MNESEAFKIARDAVIKDKDLSFDETLEVVKLLIDAENNAQKREKLKGDDKE